MVKIHLQIWRPGPACSISQELPVAIFASQQVSSSSHDAKSLPWGVCIVPWQGTPGMCKAFTVWLRGLSQDVCVYSLKNSRGYNKPFCNCLNLDFTCSSKGLWAKWSINYTLPLWEWVKQIWFISFPSRYPFPPKWLDFNFISWFMYIQTLYNWSSPSRSKKPLSCPPKGAFPAALLIAPQHQDSSVCCSGLCVALTLSE